MTQNLFITGVAGFIGSNTAEALVSKGHRVVGLDNFAEVYPRAKKEFNLTQIERAAPSPQHFQFVEGDLRDFDQVKEAMSGQAWDAILHLGAMAGVQPSIRDPELFYDVNIGGTLNVLNAARAQGCPNILFASSSSVYGGNETLPFRESDSVDRPLSPYAASKKSGELLCHSYHYLYDMSIACLRFFTVYGPRQRPDLAIYKFTRAMLKDEDITLYGDGSSSRDYTYIDDCVVGILQTLNWLQGGNPERPRYDIFNLGESESVSLHQMVHLLEKYLGKKAKKIYADYLPGDVYATYADLAHSQKTLEYQPQIKIEEGLRRFCQWFQEEEIHQSWV
ncbi:MAG: GDP-mannose 4,6-dehydratase [bacterium]|nr:GDP-mannose 4,6-dehydratase [bacterium]